MRRSSGVLLHITSLPGEYGIGGFGKEAVAFAKKLKNKRRCCDEYEERKDPERGSDCIQTRF